MGDLGGSPVPGADRTAPVQGEDPKAEGLTENAILDPVILRFAVLTYLIVLPVGHLLVISVNGTTARGRDVFLALVLLAGLIELGRMSTPYLAGRVEKLPLLTVLMDVALVAIAYFVAYLVRWDTEQLPAELAYFRQTLAMVIVLKVMGLAAAGAYAPRFRHYSLADVLGTIRANILGTLLAASVLLLVFRVGLSRGVLIVDFLLCATLTVVGRVSFRFLDDVREKWSSEGAPAAFVGRIEDAELAFRALRGLEEPRLRPVAVVDYMYGGRRGRFKGYPLFGATPVSREPSRSAASTRSS